MSFTTITQAARDEALNDRTVAAVWQEALSNPTFGGTDFGRQVQGGFAPILGLFAYPVAVDNAAAYGFAVDSGNPDPGGDPAVITDANITSAVQAHWPPDPT